jgi:hypothetical protein
VEGDPDRAGQVFLPGLRDIGQPPAPFQVTRGFARRTLLAMNLFEKCDKPLNRQSERYAREGPST